MGKLGDLLSLILHLGYIGLSVYSTVEPRAQWAAPAATALASFTKTPQSAIKDMPTNSLKMFTIIFCLGISLYNYFV